MRAIALCFLAATATTAVAVEKVQPPLSEEVIAHRLANPVQPTGAGGGPAATPGTVIVYDSGTFSAIAAGPGSNAFGNKFNTQSGVPLGATPILSSVAVWPALVDGLSAGSGNAFVSVFGPVSGTAAPVVSSASIPLAAQTWNTFAMGPFGFTGAPSFHVGLWQPGGTSACATDCIGVDTSTVNGQGNHGFNINDIVGTGYADQPWNALVRAVGSGLPAELTTFEVSED